MTPSFKVVKIIILPVIILFFIFLFHKVSSPVQLWDGVRVYPISSSAYSLDESDPNHRAINYRNRKYTYATLLTDPFGTGIDDEYFQAVRLQIFSILHRFGSKYPYTVYATHGITPSQISVLRKEGAIVKEIDMLSLPNEQPGQERWRGLYTKLSLFNDTSYEKILFLDADVFILQAGLDDLFDVSLQPCMPLELKDKRLPYFGHSVPPRLRTIAQQEVIRKDFLRMSCQNEKLRKELNTTAYGVDPCEDYWLHLEETMHNTTIKNNFLRHQNLTELQPSQHNCPYLFAAISAVELYAPNAGAGFNAAIFLFAPNKYHFERMLNLTAYPDFYENSSQEQGLLNFAYPEYSAYPFIPLPMRFCQGGIIDRQTDMAVHKKAWRSSERGSPEYEFWWDMYRKMTSYYQWSGINTNP